MNSESSRSHLVLSIIIESTNKTTGSVLKGKVREEVTVYMNMLVIYAQPYMLMSGYIFFS